MSKIKVSCDHSFKSHFACQQKKGRYVRVVAQFGYLLTGPLFQSSEEGNDELKYHSGV